MAWALDAIVWIQFLHHNKYTKKLHVGAGEATNPVAAVVLEPLLASKYWALMEII